MSEKARYLTLLQDFINTPVIGHGKTVACATGICYVQKKSFSLVDLPGTYSLMSNSAEEEIARDYICFGKQNCTIVVVDATCLERNLNLVYQVLEMTNQVVVCLNLLDEAKKKGIEIDIPALSAKLGVPVVGVVARKPKTLKKLMDITLQVCEKKCVCQPQQVTYAPVIENAIKKLEEEIQPYSQKLSTRWLAIKILEGNEAILKTIQQHNSLDISLFQPTRQMLFETLEQNDITSENITDMLVSNILFDTENTCRKVVCFKKQDYEKRDLKLDKILTSKRYGIPIMLLLLGIVFWLTIVGSNYPSKWLSSLFAIIEKKLWLLFTWLNCPSWLSEILLSGLYRTTAWVVSVMLPPMAIFFPLFTLLEDSGFLPRIAFNLDHLFQKAGTSGKQALTMCMGFGCNAAGIIGCRIITSPRERLIAILTNAFVPCNGRFPFLITIATIFLSSSIFRHLFLIWCYTHCFICRITRDSFNTAYLKMAF